MVVSLSMEQAQKMEWCKAQQIALSVDLVEAAKKQLQFLAAVDSTGFLYEGPAVERAIYRYKYCWLPLLAKHMECPVLEGLLVVPLDCEWIWHCHRLNPVQYKRDCEEIYGRILGNLNVLSIVEGTCSKHTEWVWDQLYVTEPYYLDLPNAQLHVCSNRPDAEVQKSIDYDLVAAVERQSSFFTKISRAIKYDDSFLEEAVDRYKAFLHIIKKSGERRMKYSCVPSHDIDLIWHSHLLYPIAYSKDLKAIFGGVLDHNDRDSSGNSGCKKLLHGFLRTKELWELTYGCMYGMGGDMPKSNKGLKGSIMVPKGLANKASWFDRMVLSDDVVREAGDMLYVDSWGSEGAEDMICWYNCWPAEAVEF